MSCDAGQVRTELPNFLKQAAQGPVGNQNGGAAELPRRLCTSPEPVRLIVFPACYLGIHRLQPNTPDIC